MGKPEISSTVVRWTIHPEPKFQPAPIRSRTVSMQSQLTALDWKRGLFCGLL